MAPNAVALVRICIISVTAAALRASWTLGKKDMVCKCDEAHATVEHLNTGLMGLCKQFSGKETLQSEVCDAEDASSGFESL